jgi:hypothetical protein
VLRTGATRSPRKSRIEVSYIDQEVAAELFLAIDKGAIEHLSFAVDGAYCGCRRDGLESI